MTFLTARAVRRQASKKTTSGPLAPAAAGRRLALLPFFFHCVLTVRVGFLDITRVGFLDTGSVSVGTFCSRLCFRLYLLSVAWKPLSVAWKPHISVWKPLSGAWKPVSGAWKPHISVWKPCAAPSLAGPWFLLVTVVVYPAKVGYTGGLV